MTHCLLEVWCQVVDRVYLDEVYFVKESHVVLSGQESFKFICYFVWSYQWE